VRGLASKGKMDYILAMFEHLPSLVFADAEGRVMDFPDLAMVARSGDYLLPAAKEEVIPLPEGSQLYVLPERMPVGLDRKTGEVVVLESNPYEASSPVSAVAVFLPAAYTQTYLAAWERSHRACELPLLAYTALGWQDGFVTTAVRTDPSTRQDPNTFDREKIEKGILQWLQDLPGNRLVEHLVSCATCYGCPAALNLFQGREEAPLPTSPSCNAACVGCISLQVKGRPPSPQKRITFVPTPEEIAEVALRHIATADSPVVSFGQGCEGEPLIQAETICRAIGLVRSKTTAGTINLNTNASMPGMVARLADAGLDSIRISMNSARRETYEKYFRPSYPFDALSESAREMKKRGRFVSINLFVFPGLTDAPKEAQALRRFVEDNEVDMIQWRNLNLDPDVYLEMLGQNLPAGVGIRRLMDEIPCRRGYFNPYLG